MGQTESAEESIDGGCKREERHKAPTPTKPLPEEFTRRFEVLEEVGKGNFGFVYRVKDTKTKAIYAAKHLEYNSSNIKEVSTITKRVQAQPV